jgi:hypothetical protein
MSGFIHRSGTDLDQPNHRPTAIPDVSRQTGRTGERWLTVLKNWERTEELIHQFIDHFKTYIRVDPSSISRKNEIFESWAIQKTACLQLEIEHLASNLPGQGNGNQDECLLTS